MKGLGLFDLTYKNTLKCFLTVKNIIMVRTAMEAMFIF